MKRQTMIAKIKKQFPELLAKFKEEKTRVFPTHSIVGVLPEARLRLFRVIKEFEVCAEGDFLVVSLGVWRFDKIAVVSTGARRDNLIGFLRRDNRSFILESKNKELLQFDEEIFIVGEAIGYCSQADYKKYVKERERGLPVDFPIVFFE